MGLFRKKHSRALRQKGTRLQIRAKLPSQLSIPDTQLCTLVSNGLENALLATRDLDASLSWVDFYCEVKLNKFLIKIKNPYAGEIFLSDGLPVSSKAGHGCKSLQIITQQYHGLCAFHPDSGLFTLRIVLPLHD